MNGNDTFSKLLAHSGRTSREVELATGAHPETIRLWRLGRHRPDGRYYVPLAELLGISIAELVQSIDLEFRVRNLSAAS